MMSLQNFVNAIDSPFTVKTYTNSLKLYLEYHNLKNFDNLLEIEDKETTFNMIRDFIIYQRKTKLRSHSRINIHLSAIRLFYSVNRYQGGIIDWFTLARFKGKERKRMVNDRSYTREEISKLLEFADLRMKVAILMMVSTGIRVGGLATIKMKDLEYIEQYKLYRVFVYSEYIDDKYYTFTTPECASFIKLYLETRERNHGEVLGPESPLIRKDFDSAKNLALPSHSIQERIRLIVLESGIKKKKLQQQENNNNKITYPLPYEPSQPSPIHLLNNNNNNNNINEGIVVDLVEIRRQRSEIMNCHGFRKFFDSVCVESEMKYLPKEILMGHKREQGLDRHYYRPTSETLLNEYLKVVDDLTLNDEYRLSKQVQQLKEKDDYNKYIIDKKLKDKDLAIENMQEAMKTVYEQVETFTKSFKDQTINKLESKLEELKTSQLEQQSKLKIVLGIGKELNELFNTKGFVTKEDMELIYKSINNKKR